MSDTKIRKELERIIRIANWTYGRNNQLVYSDDVRHLVKNHKAIWFIKLIAEEVLPHIKTINDHWRYFITIIDNPENENEGKILIFEKNSGLLISAVKLFNAVLFPRFGELSFDLICVNREAETFCLSCSIEI